MDTESIAEVISMTAQQNSVINRLPGVMGVAYWENLWSKVGIAEDGNPWRMISEEIAFELNFLRSV
ncbi:hypothetical protein [Thermococcus sp. GR7]|uniref:hypothetical protein n=1 Tax=Thermococcus sp. GR7 TaxID=1638257 RepID=UPI00142F8606|nr:hypothetical protein [Thermococcus sp. GR7]